MKQGTLSVLSALAVLAAAVPAITAVIPDIHTAYYDAIRNPPIGTTVEVIVDLNGLY